MVSETVLAKNRQESHRGPDLKLFVRDVRDALGKKKSFVVRSWATIKDAKEAIRRITQLPVNAQRLYFGPLLSSGKELPNYRTLHDAGIYKSGETLLLEIISKNHEGGNSFASMSSLRINANDICVSTSLLSSTPRPLRYTVQNARRAFALGIKPDLVMDGSGGSYFIHDPKKNKIAVFKPADEEPYAENNPRGYLPQAGQDQAGALREGIAPGEACIREVAAFLLDHNGFADVPMTTLAEARHPAFNTNGARLKVSEGGASIGAHSIFATSSVSVSNHQASLNVKKVGSFQEFIRAEGSMDDLSPSKLSVEQVHKIAILDIRLLNADRNAANLLCRRLPDNSLELVPIDHGYCLRSMCDVSWMDWCWLDWPQLKEPLSPKSKEYIRKLDIEADARILQERLNISGEAIDYLRASTAILKAGVEAGLSLYNIAVMCCRNDMLGEKPSLLEHLTNMASELAQMAVQSEDYHHAAASQALEEQLSPKRPSVVTSRDRSSSRSFHRCASSGEFLSLAQDMDDDDHDDGFFLMDSEDQTELSKAMHVDDSRSSLSKALDEAAKSSPPLAQLSGSDASSDNGNAVEKEEMQQWASVIIEDSFQTEFPLPERNPLSGSLSSDEGSLATSPKGFWHVRPGFSSAAAAAALSDDDSASLHSFGTSPSDEPSTAIASSGCNRRQSVTFADPPTRSSFLPSKGPFLRPPTTVDVSTQDEDAEVIAASPLVSASPIVGLHKSMIVGRQDSTASTGMSRSKSYTALSRSFSSTGSGSSPKEAPNAFVMAAAKRSESFEDHEYFRTYFLKFMDLVIVREMARQQSAIPVSH
mmetsp:Transcript_9116/g.18926  ORF Transcript_9116/g.18926 Transcript_9116/m.18926 type:complete len:818 (-) Transcript_9116:321-2774(-)|eukprot:CAMPEP_0172444300 /NCGR_PEP_ID=MMETSP1065-20121228/4356_1 /TAXON_ID=265537 /ORGANISM="Amphiprora paludosa, Strain CCMP125" /LENGTH=817 /DNA_ID=CAMNT_0013194777 /DNA_START=532 /DNA_END=2985 /DNA_ORIENTATION=+